MKKTFALGFVVAAACVVAGCKSDEDRLVELTIEKAEAVEKAGDDCTKMGEALEGFNKSHGKEYRELRDKTKDKYKGEEGKKKEEELKQKYGDKLEKAKKTMISAAFKCHDNAAWSKGIEAEKQ
jgi:hypothetical protein